MSVQSFQFRLTHSVLNDPHEIDDYWFLQCEPERGERYVRDLIEVAETELPSPMRAQSGRLFLVELCTTTVPLGEAEFFEPPKA